MEQIELIQKAQRGDNAAWEHIVRSHQEAVFRLAYLYTGDEADAGDVAQETFIRAYKALERFDTTRKLKPWLLSIAANQAAQTAAAQLAVIGQPCSAGKQAAAKNMAM